MNGRIALYSHDTMGLGHVRRNLLIGQVLSEGAESRTVLLFSGTRAATHFDLPARVDCLTLPGLRKEPDGRYTSRRLTIDLLTLTHLRAATIKAALDAFDPDLLIVDAVPAGANGELMSSLAWTRMRGTRVVLGLRDVLDDPGQVGIEWRRARNEEIIKDYYDEVWVYGDPAVYDMAREYEFSKPVVAKLRYTGYLNQRRRLDRIDESRKRDKFDLGPMPVALCLVGGGEDGAHLAEAFAMARAPHNARRVIVTGPFMTTAGRRALKRCVTADPTLTVLGFVEEPTRLIEQAACIVAMGGYNTTCEVLSFNKRALIVPRVRPRLEQWIRATRLQELGRVDVLSPEMLTADKVTEWLAVNFGQPVDTRATVDLDGLRRVKDLADRLIATESDRTAAGLRKVSHVV